MGVTVAGWIITGALAGVLAGLVAWYWKPTAAVAGAFIVDLGGFLGYENIVEATNYRFGAGSCSILLPPQERLDCLDSALQRAMAVGGFTAAAAIVGLIVYGIAEKSWGSRQ